MKKYSFEYIDYLTCSENVLVINIHFGTITSDHHLKQFTSLKKHCNQPNIFFSKFSAYLDCTVSYKINLADDEIAHAERYG